MLVDPRLGGCLDRGSDSLLVGTGLGKIQVESAVEKAAQLARRDGGTLILALLGHGEGSGGAALHFVTSGKRNDPPLTNVNVTSLLNDTLNHPGLNGLVAIVDTCLSGGAVPAAPDVTSGRQKGDVRFSLLFAATAHQPAYDMRLSTELTRLIAEGLPGAGKFLKVDDDLMERLGERIRGQQPGRNIFDGGSRVGDALWLARNHVAFRSGPLGPIAKQALQDASRRVDRSLLLSTEEELVAWLKDNEHTTGGGSWIAVQRLREVQAELEAGRKTLSVISSVFGPVLTEESLQLVGVLAGLPLDFVRQEPPRTLRDTIEHAAHHGSTADGQQRALAHVVAAMAHVTRHRGQLPPEVLAWAQDLELTAVLNSRLDELNHQPDGDQAPRLVLVLADDGGESVVRVDAWLLFGRAVLSRSRFPCGAGHKELKRAMAEAVAWALPWANIAKQPMQRIDVAAPTLVLLDSPPEEHVVRKQKLAVNYTVTTRWSGLLTPPIGVTVEDMLQVGARLLASLDDSDCCGPKWLQGEHLQTVDHLQQHLSNHGFGQHVWALSSLPESDWDYVAQELLEHAPALVWPRQKDVSNELVIQASVGKHWQALPQQISHAYRTHLSGASPSDDDLGPLATVRAAWHDRDWHAFCLRRADTIVSAPDEMASKERA
ncbi:hypothetical protein OHT68_14065 [Streptomyces canus]|uniref:vWA-MoxR associated conflict system protein n=1 Tax=Streptomyces canus TaxID=58343 RepID=UPI002E2E1443|nr:hypothetical protein [Streptomyces canus]